MTSPALLALADGSVFRGVAIGAEGETVGEVVFNTAMSGYQEILTDPSYSRQIVTLTYPHIGNTGCNAADTESSKVHAAGLVIRDLPLAASNWRSEETLDAYLRRNNIVGIAEIDTRRLTRILRDKGAQNGCLLAGASLSEEHAIASARAFPGLKGMDLAKVVSVKERYSWREGSYDLDKAAFVTPPLRFRVVAFDYGIKRNILRMLVDRGCDVTVVPARDAGERCDCAASRWRAARERPRRSRAVRLRDRRDPRADPREGADVRHLPRPPAARPRVGAKTIKMKFGHHGANHPVIDLKTGRVMISSQNHGFAVDEATLPANVKATHRSLFDGSLQGIRLNDAPAFSFQGHPEASPGPHDVAGLFDQFIELMEARAAAAA